MTASEICNPGSGIAKNSKLKIGISALFFVIFTFIGSLVDLDVFLLKIPAFNQLETGDGTIVFNLIVLSRGSPLILANKGKTIELNCWITSIGIKDCIPKNDKRLYSGKKAKAWWYTARINGFSTEKRLLQLEVDGKLVINYLNQKNKYYEYKNNHIYMWPIFFCIALFWFVLVILSNNYRS